MIPRIWFRLPLISKGFKSELRSELWDTSIAAAIENTMIQAVKLTYRAGFHGSCDTHVSDCSLNPNSIENIGIRDPNGSD